MTEQATRSAAELLVDEGLITADQLIAAEASALTLSLIHI